MQPSFDEGPDGDGFDLVDNGDELYEYDEHEVRRPDTRWAESGPQTPDCGPARSLIRNTWQMPDAEAGPVEISAEEFNTSQGRDMFLSQVLTPPAGGVSPGLQSCPTWGSLSYFPARPSANTADKLDEVCAELLLSSVFETAIASGRMLVRRRWAAGGCIGARVSGGGSSSGGAGGCEAQQDEF